jgi:microcompartment protein CcmL/EutN
MPRFALGLIETIGIDGAMTATRAASDSGQVVIVSAEQGPEGRMTVKIEGEWSAVQSAVEAGARAAYDVRELVSMHVIPKPDQEVISILPYSRFVDRFAPGDTPRTVEKLPRVPARSKADSPAPSRKGPVKVKPETAKPTAPIPTPQSGAVSTPSLGTTVPAPGAARLPGEQLEQMAVVALRRYARTIPELPIKGREISKANKQQLLEAIASIRGAK